LALLPAASLEVTCPALAVYLGRACLDGLGIPAIRELRECDPPLGWPALWHVRPKVPASAILDVAAMKATFGGILHHNAS